MNFRGWSSILIIVGAMIFAAQADAQIIFRPDETPEPHSISQLRKVSKLEKLNECQLPSVTTPAIGTTLKGLSGGLYIDMPGKWERIESDTTKSAFHEPELIYQSESKARIAVIRITSGVSRSFIADPASLKPLPASDCEITSDSAGTIWTMYPSGGDPGVRARSTALGDAVTQLGQRYKFRVGSWSAAERDSLAAYISAAVIRK